MTAKSHFRDRVLRGEFVGGTWIVLGSSLAAEIVGRAGFDWVLIDMEHGMGGYDALLGQLQAVGSTDSAAFVRVDRNDPAEIRRTLDLGPDGIMIPQVSTEDDAKRAVEAMNYPPEGVRGVSPYIRPSNFGLTFDDYRATLSETLVCVVQIETPEAVQNAGAIAAVDGVDVLFVGPYDLSVGLGIVGQFDHPAFLAAIENVASATRAAGKIAGSLVLDSSQLERSTEKGYSFIGSGSDGGLLAASMTELAGSFDRFRVHKP